MLLCPRQDCKNHCMRILSPHAVVAPRRGFGTVRYSTPEDAQGATEIMNGAEIGGRTITVRIDRFA